jgi:bacterioferritin-associated ferredoxin
VIPPLPAPYLGHLVAPRGLGDLPGAQATGHMGSMVGGMGVRVSLVWRGGRRGEARIGAIAVRVVGSAAPIAPASWLAGHVGGMTPEEAGAIRPADLLAGLAGSHACRLPAAVHKGATFVVDALRSALGAGDARPADPCGPGLLVCRCLGVGDREIRCAVASGARTPDQVADACGAGLGCRSCRPDVRVLLHEETSAPRPAPPEDLPPVARVVWARVAPVLEAQDQRLRDVEVTGSAVGLRLERVAASPSISPRGAQEIARHLLRETVWEEIGVEVLA